MADFDLGGLLFGNAPSSGLESYLDPEQLRRMQQQGVMQAAMALLKASGPSTQRVGLGQALGGAYEAGQAGYQQAQQQGLAGMMTKQKLEEAARAQKMQENYAKMVAGLTGGEAPGVSAMTTESALAAPVTADLPAGPTVARAAMVGQPTSSMSIPAISGGAMQRGNLSPQMAALLSALPAKEGIPELMKYMQPAKTSGEPFRGADGQTYIRTETGGVIPFSTGVAPKPVGAPHQATNAAGKAVLVQSYDDGSQQEISGLSPYETSPTEVKLLREAGLPPTLENIIKVRQSGVSPGTTINMPGNKELLGGVGKDISATLSDLTAGARTANQALQTIDRMLPALDKAIVGPAADYRTGMLRIGQQLGIAGADANAVLANTRTVVQGLAQQELDAASQMKGQGSLTEAERAILKRAASGDQTLSAAEIQQSLSTAQKVARYRLQAQQDYLSRVSKLPDFQQFAPMYQVTPYQSQNQFPTDIQNILNNQRRLPGGSRP